MKNARILRELSDAMLNSHKSLGLAVSVLGELQVIASEIARRCLADPAYALCPMCEQNPVNFRDVFFILSRFAEGRENIIDLIEKGAPIGFVCCHCAEGLEDWWVQRGLRG